MNQKYLFTCLVAVIIILAGSTIYFALTKRIQSATTKDKNSGISQVENIKQYENDTYGYKIQYPIFFDLNDSKSDNVGFSNATCDPNNKLCFLGIDSINIYISDNSDGIGFAEKYNEMKKYNNTCKQLSIFPLPENFNENELIKAIRCEFPEVPKQAKGGYNYTILHNNKIFETTFYQGDSTITAYVNGSLYNIAKDNYDPIGDTMMRTFKFTR